MSKLILLTVSGTLGIAFWWGAAKLRAKPAHPKLITFLADLSITCWFITIVLAVIAKMD
jgi:hypothetical protein